MAIASRSGWRPKRSTGALTPLRCCAYTLIISALLAGWNINRRLQAIVHVDSLPASPQPPPSQSLAPPPPSSQKLSSTTARAPAANQTRSLFKFKCARVRRDRLLLYAAHSGFGNQELSLRRALLVAYVSNRTLVLPPILRQSDLAFGVPEVRCRDASWQGQLQSRAERVYESKLTGMNSLANTDGYGNDGSADPASSPYESLLRAYDFDELERMGMLVVDYSRLPAATRSRLASSPLAAVGCAKQHRYSAHSLREALRNHSTSEVVRLGSAYFLHADLDGLRHSDACFDAVVSAVLRLPLAGLILDTSQAALRRMQSPFASVHLRLADAGANGDEGAAAGGAERQLRKEIAWVRGRLTKRASRAALFVATNVPSGVRSPLLGELCAQNRGGVEGQQQHDAHGHELRQCSDLASLGVLDSTEWQALRGGRDGGAASGGGASGVTGGRLSAGTAAMLVEQAVGAAAPRGFFSTSKFCGPPGFRRSTFSEGIALRWAQQHGPAPPLCAHAMEHALPKGMAAHSTFVY